MNIATLIARMRLMVARAIVQLVDDAKGVQGLQVKLQANVVRDGVERFQQYGLTSVPHAGAEGVALSVGGSTDRVVVISVDDRRYRLAGLEGGEVALYDDFGQAVHLTRGGIEIRGAGKPITLTDTSGIILDADVRVSKNFRVDGDVEFTSGNVRHRGVNFGSDHQHDGVQPGNGRSGPPTTS